jgi:hypothetical protein
MDDMFALSFRIKLLLAMMLLVAGVTGATLLITQREVHLWESTTE